MDQSDQVVYILARPRAKINQIMLFDPVDAIVFCRRRKRHPRQLFEFFQTPLQIITIIRSQDHIGLSLGDDLRTEILPFLRGIGDVDSPCPVQHLLLGPAVAEYEVLVGRLTEMDHQHPQRRLARIGLAQ